MRSETFAYQSGLQDPRIIQPGYPDSPSRPRGKANRPQAADDRCEAQGISYLKPRASGPKALPQKGQESELTISPIQLLSCGGRERRTPLTSKEDSANAVGIAPMALPLDLAMEVGTPGHETVGLTGNILALPCQSIILRRMACGRALIYGSSA
jgi:hypothetical protein